MKRSLFLAVPALAAALLFPHLIDQLALSTDQVERLALSDDIFDLLLREVPAIPKTGSEITYWGYWDHLKGMMPADNDFYGFYELHKWDNVWLDR